MQISGLLKVTITVLYNSLAIFQKRRSQIFFKIGILKISQISPVLGPQTCNIIKKRLQHCCFPVKFAKSLKAPYL